MIDIADINHLFSEEFYMDEKLFPFSTVPCGYKLLAAHQHVQSMRERYDGTEKEHTLLDLFGYAATGRLDAEPHIATHATSAMLVVLENLWDKRAQDFIQDVADTDIHGFGMARAMAAYVASPAHVADIKMTVTLDERGKTYPDVQVVGRAQQVVGQRKHWHVANLISVNALRAVLRERSKKDRPEVSWVFYGKEVHFDDNLRSEDAWGDPRVNLDTLILNSLL